MYEWGLFDEERNRWTDFVCTCGGYAWERYAYREEPLYSSNSFLVDMGPEMVLYTYFRQNGPTVAMLPYWGYIIAHFEVSIEHLFLERL